MMSYRRPEQKVPALELLRRSSIRGAQPQTNTTACSSSPPLQPDRLPVPSIAEDGRSATRPHRLMKKDRKVLVLVTLSGRFQDCYTFTSPFNKRTGFPPARKHPLP